MDRAIFLPTSNFYNIQSGATAGSPRTTWAPIGNTSQAPPAHFLLVQHAFRRRISPNQYGGGNVNSSKPDGTTLPIMWMPN
jgi:hypothetical protein